MKTEERLTFKNDHGLFFGFITIEKSHKIFPNKVSCFRNVNNKMITILDSFVVLEPGNLFGTYKTNWVSNNSEKITQKHLLTKVGNVEKMIKFLNIYFKFTKQRVKIQTVANKRLGNDVISIIKLSNCFIKKFPKDLSINEEDFKKYLEHVFPQKKVRQKRFKVRNIVISFTE